MNPRALALAAGSVLAMTGPLTADDQLPITALTLYRSGVGSFERTGLVEGDADIQLRFDADQINDILKSMVALDLDGGRIESVSYGSREPLERRLASFGINIADNPSMAELLARVRGAPIRVRSPEGDATGTALGVEKRQVAQADTTIEADFLNLLTPAGIRSVMISEITSLEILDEKLAEELNKALTALAEQRADTIKTVDIGLRGDGARRIAVIYIHEMPVWKTSYRLVLPEESSRAGGGQPQLQGWAIVENTTDEDWNNVQLSLVAGMPVSFIMDLYEPLFSARPEVPVPTAAGVTPRLYEGGVAEVRAKALELADRAERQRRGVPPPAAAPAEPGAGGDFFAGQAVTSVAADDMTRYAAAAQASGASVGEVFQYTLDVPVSIERQRSAMLPIISAGIDGRRVSIYNRGALADHPMRGVELTNSTDLQLMPGPISVFDGAAYAGDSQIGHVGAGDKRLLSYAVDLDVKVTTEDSGTSEIDSIRISGGVLVQTTSRESTTTYTLANNDEQRGRTVILEHPKLGGWTLVKPEKIAEETDSLYRFEAELPAGEAGKVDVVQTRTERSQTALVSADINWLAQMVRRGKVSDAVLEAVRKAANFQSRINEAERQIAELDRERDAISADQGRIRENMKTIDSRSELYQRYLTKLNDQETRLEEIRQVRGEQQAEADQARRELADYLRNLNVS
ncbi:MAG: hypothetical protein ACF8R7_00290 [Phycisphaerales bacterium JB039]